MTATNKTTNYELPLFVDDDQPTWLGDFNGAMNKIDSDIGQVATTASNALSLAKTNEADIAIIDSQLAGTAESGLSELIKKKMSFFENFTDVANLHNGELVYVEKTASIYKVDDSLTPNNYDVIGANGYVLALQNTDGVIRVNQLLPAATTDYAPVINFALANYDVVILPKGEYPIKSAITVPEHKTITGARHETIINAFNSDAVHIAGRYATVKNLILYGADSATDAASLYNGVTMAGGIDNYHVLLEDLWAQQFANGFYNDGNTVWSCMFERLRAVKCTVGFHLNGNASFGNIYSQIYTDHCQTGMTINKELGSVFNACNFGAISFPCLDIANSSLQFTACNFEADTDVASGAFIKLGGYTCTLSECKINLAKVVSTDRALFDISGQTNLSNITLANNNAASAAVNAIKDNTTAVRRNMFSVIGQNVSISFNAFTHKNSEIMYSLPNLPIRYYSGESDSQAAITAIVNNGPGTIAYDKSTSTLKYVKAGSLVNL